MSPETPMTGALAAGAEQVPLRQLYEVMALIRAFESRVSSLYRDGAIPGFVHTSLGQEAVAAGICSALRREDAMTTTHRGHGHVIAKGADPDRMMAELFGRADGLCGGKGGSMHVADPSAGILGANAIVGAGIPLAVGAGLSSKLLKQGRVAVAFFGEGAVNQGAFHEAVNLAAIWNLPVVLVCENNAYAEFSESDKMTRIPAVADRSIGGYGVDAVQVDGNDVRAVLQVAVRAVEQCRSGGGPVLIEASTYRWHGHYEGDQQPYKSAEEIERWKSRDPLNIAALALLEAGELDEATIAATLEAAERRIDQALEFARSAPYPEDAEALQHVFA